MSQNSLQKTPFQAENSALSDSVSAQNSASLCVVKCLSVGAYFVAYNISGALVMTGSAVDARTYDSASMAAAAVNFLKRNFAGFAWASVPVERAQ